MPLLTIEIFESTARSTAAPALARTADLRTYAVAQEAWFFGREGEYRERQDKPEWLRVFYFQERWCGLRGFYICVSFGICQTCQMDPQMSMGF